VSTTPSLLRSNSWKSEVRDCAKRALRLRKSLYAFSTFDVEPAGFSDEAGSSGVGSPALAPAPAPAPAPALAAAAAWMSADGTGCGGGCGRKECVMEKCGGGTGSCASCTLPAAAVEYSVIDAAAAGAVRTRDRTPCDKSIAPALATITAISVATIAYVPCIVVAARTNSVHSARAPASRQAVSVNNTQSGPPPRPTHKDSMIRKYWTGQG
jgi:hypothetical protein